VRRTGGLADTVRDQQEARGLGNGFVFDAPRGDALAQKVEEAVRACQSEPQRFGMMRRGMAEDFSVGESARKYLALYRRLVS
jgi:glycogen synthase